MITYTIKYKDRTEETIVDYCFRKLLSNKRHKEVESIFFKPKSQIPSELQLEFYDGLVTMGLLESNPGVNGLSLPSSLPTWRIIGIFGLMRYPELFPEQTKAMVALKKYMGLEWAFLLGHIVIPHLDQFLVLYVLPDQHHFIDISKSDKNTYRTFVKNFNNMGHLPNYSDSIIASGLWNIVHYGADNTEVVPYMGDDMERLMITTTKLAPQLNLQDIFKWHKGNLYTPTRLKEIAGCNA